MSRARAYLELVRLPNLFTAIADIVAGFAFAGGDTAHWPTLLWLSASSVCLYAGGVALNDVCDSTVDAALRPERPIPSGRLQLAAAKRLAIGLLTLGVVLAATASIASGLVACSLVVCVVLYDAVLKQNAMAPGIMGGCRALNFCLPLAALGAFTGGAGFLIPVGAIWLYVTSLTYFARGEAVRNRRLPLAIGTLGVCFATAGLLGMRWAVPLPHEEFSYAVGTMLVILAVYGTSAVRRPEPETIQRAVGVFVILVAGLGVCIAWASRGLGFAAAVTGLAVVAAILGSKRLGLRVT